MRPRPFDSMGRSECGQKAKEDARYIVTKSSRSPIPAAPAWFCNISTAPWMLTAESRYRVKTPTLYDGLSVGNHLKHFQTSMVDSFRLARCLLLIELNELLAAKLHIEGLWLTGLLECSGTPPRLNPFQEILTHPVLLAVPIGSG